MKKKKKLCNENNTPDYIYIPSITNLNALAEHKNCFRIPQPLDGLKLLPWGNFLEIARKTLMSFNLLEVHIIPSQGNLQ